MNRVLFRIFVLLLLLAVDFSIASAQLDVDLGKRPIRNFAPSEYGYSRQNWTSTQLDSGLLYFGNQNGILEFDGNNWELIPAASGTTIRCLLTSNYTLYVGGKGDFGFLKESPGERLQYVSISESRDLPDFADLWSCAAIGDAVFFLSSKVIFKYEKESIETFHLTEITGSDENDFYSIFASGNEIFISVAGGSGLYQFDENTFRRLDSAPTLPSTVVGVLDSPSQGILALTSRNGLFQFESGKFIPFPTEVDSFLKSNRMYDATLLSQNKIALSSTTGGVVIIGNDGENLWEINEASGLSSNAVYDLLEDRNENIWMATEYGISMSEASSPYAVIDRTKGLRGAPEDASQFEGKLYVASSNGLFAYSPSEQSMSQINNDRNMGLVEFDDHMLVATYGDLWTYRSGKMSKLTEERYFVRAVHRSEINTDVVLLGTLKGLAAIRLRDGNWEELGYLAEFNGDASSIVENTKTNEIYIGTDFRGLVKVVPDFDQPEESTMSLLGLENGLPNLDQIRVRKVDGEVRLLNKEGVFKVEGNQVEKDEAFNEIEASLSSEFKDILETSNGIWGGTWKDGLVKMNYDFNSAKYVIEGSYLGDKRIGELRASSNGAIWALGDEEAIRLNELDDQRSFEFDTIVRNIRDLRADSVVYHASVFLDSDEKLELPFSSNSIRITFANLGFDSNFSSFYRVLLEGNDEQFSSWSSESQKDYTNLEPGTYLFKVQGRNRRTRNDSMSEILITIKPPWYRSLWAYMVYSLLLLTLVYLGLRFVRRQILARERSRSFQKLSEAHFALQKSHDSLRQTKNKLVQAEKLASMGQLTAGIAHEIKNPLNFINNFVQLNSELLIELKQELQEKTESKVSDVLPDLKDIIDNIRDNSDIINKHGQRADRVVQSMMEHSRGGKGELSKVSLNEFVEEYVHLAYFAIKSKKKGINIELTQDYDPSCGNTVLMTQELGQVIINLLNNAYDAIVSRAENESGDYAPSLKISTHRPTERNILQIQISDNGSGMSEEVKARIFEPFYTTKASGEGTGLGLSLSHDIITLGHSGQISVDSTLGQGTQFTLTLPIVESVEEALKKAPTDSEEN